MPYPSIVSRRLSGSHRGGARALTAVLAVAGIIALGACAGRGAETPATSAGDTDGSRSVARIAIVTPEKESDHGWNQQGLRAAEAAAEQRGIALDAHTNVGYDNTESILTQVAGGDVDLIIAHASGFNAAGHRVGQQTGVPTLVVDYENNEPGVVATAIPAPQEGAYLAGVAAAMRTETGTVGIVASAENLNWFLMAGGFAQGVLSVDPSINVVMAYVGPANYADSAGAAQTTKQVIAAGADVIMGMGNGATIGYLQAIETADTSYPISYIATIGDVSDIAPDMETVLATVLWDFTDTYLQAIADIEAGTFGTHGYELTVANGGLSLQENAGFTAEMSAAVAQAAAGITDGSITVAYADTKDAVQAILDTREG